MLFQRRKPARTVEKLRAFVWPRKGFSRSYHYFRLRVLRLTASPHAVAIGVAAGVFSSCTPFVGLHLLLAIVIAYLLAGNLLAAALGSAVGNPLTLPFIWASSWEAGNFILGADQATRPPLDLEQMLHRFDLGQIWGPVLEPMIVGSIPLAGFLGAVFYIVTFHGVRSFQMRRRAHLAERMRLRAGEGIASA